VPLETAPLSEGYYVNAVLVGEAKDLHHLIAALRKDHGVRWMRGVGGKESKEGPAVTFELFPTGEDLVFRQDAR
jgi:hypothetical protein